MKKKLLIYTISIAALFSCSRQAKQTEQPLADVTIGSDEKYAQEVNAGTLQDTIKKSVARKTSTIINKDTISIAYHSPGVRGRVIWGGLVPYGQVWVTGAHSATKINFTSDTKFGQATLAAGTYAIFSIPGKEEWTFILNKNFEQHLADDYKAEEDILRINIKPVNTKDTIQRLTYEIKPNGEGSGSIIMRWETIRLNIPFVVTNNKSPEGSMAVTGKKLTGIMTDEKRDPVCYMPVTAGITDTTTYKKKLYGFCSVECKRLFISDPESYIAKAIK